MGIFFAVLFFGHLDKEVVINVMITVDPRLTAVVLKYLIAVSRTIHLHVNDVLRKLGLSHGSNT